jgi:hypothetical protein
VVCAESSDYDATRPASMITRRLAVMTPVGLNGLCERAKDGRRRDLSLDSNKEGLGFTIPRCRVQYYKQSPWMRALVRRSRRPSAGDEKASTMGTGEDKPRGPVMLSRLLSVSMTARASVEWKQVFTRVARQSQDMKRGRRPGQ